MVYLDHVIQYTSVEGGKKSYFGLFGGKKSYFEAKCDFLPPVNNSAICEPIGVKSRGVKSRE